MLNILYGKKEWSKVLKIALPMIIAAVTSIVMGMTDVIIVGRHSAEGLAGVSAGVVIVTIFIELTGAFFIGHYILASKRNGSKDMLGLGQGLMAALYIALIISVISSLILALSINPLVSLITGNPAEQIIAIEYSLWRIPGIFFFALSYVLQTIFDTQSKSKIGMYSTLAAVVINIPLTIIFVFGFFIIPEIGPASAGLATSFAGLVRLVILAVILFKQGFHTTYKLTLSFNSKEVFNQLKITYPEFITTIFFASSSYVLLFIMGLIEFGVSGGRILLLNINLIFLIAFRLGLSLQICLGQELGKEDFNAFDNFVKRGGTLLVIILSSFSLFYFAIPHTIARIFTNIETIQISVAESLWTVGVTTPLIALTMIYQAVLKAHAETKVVMYSNITSLWLIQVPTAYILGISLGLGLPGVFFSYIVFYLTRWLFTYAYFKKKFNKERMEIKAKQVSI